MKVEPHDGTSDLIKGTPGSSLSPSTMLRCRDVSVVRNPEPGHAGIRSQTSNLHKCEK